MLIASLSQLEWSHFFLLAGSLALAFGFEMVNGFHDTANAVATVIYTKALSPTKAVVWSGLCNIAGILVGGIGVAFSIVHLLPVDLLMHINTSAGLAMVLSLLGAALLWNFGTWYLGLPASSSHALIGSILGVGIAHSLMAGKGWTNGLNFTKLTEVGFSLLLSPLIGFGLSALLLVWARKAHPDPKLHEPAPSDRPPPLWIRGILFGTCTGVSFAHGSNDGQKGMGLVMLILIGLLPTQFALNFENDAAALRASRSATELKEMLTQRVTLAPVKPRSFFREAEAAPLHEDLSPEFPVLIAELQKINNVLKDKQSFREVPENQRWALRQTILQAEQELVRIEESFAGRISKPQQALLTSLHNDLKTSIEYVPRWVILCVALALGLGTMVGWKRVVITVGEKIGKSHLTYSQGASAEFVAMSTIGLADVLGLPVSTTQVLSSGVAGTMWANQSGLNFRTIQGICLAWVLTLPAAMLLSAGLLCLFRFAFGI